MSDLLVIETVEQLQALAEAAQSTFSGFQVAVLDVMTPERAAFVRRLRVGEDYSWRAVADRCHEEWDARDGWSPPSNQLMGMALCEAAALAHGEDYWEAPWN